MTTRNNLEFTVMADEEKRVVVVDVGGDGPDGVKITLNPGVAIAMAGLLQEAALRVWPGERRPE